MNKTYLQTLLISFLLGMTIVLIDFKTSSRGANQWGIYGITALRVSLAYVIAGFALLGFSKKQMGLGILTSGLILALIGASICSGELRF